MDRRVLVIGSGVAGVSACLHISEKCPTTQLSLVSHHSPIAASDDHSKIVRIDYANEARIREAQLAQNGWIQGSFAPYHTSCGRVVAYDEDSQTLKGIDQSRERLGLQARRRGNKDFFDTFFGPSGAPSTLAFLAEMWSPPAPSSLHLAAQPLDLCRASPPRLRPETFRRGMLLGVASFRTS